MRQKLYEYLLERPAGSTPSELLDLVFTQPAADPELGPRFLRTLLAPDARFAWVDDGPGAGRWTLRLDAVLAQPLSDTTFVVVDIETTGLAKSADGIIEIGAARLHGGKVVAEFQQLVNPGIRLPPFIVRLTGIDEALLADQPRIGSVWPQFVEFLGDDVLVAHNAGFDLGFLNAAAVALSGRSLPHPHLCTLKLARRLLPQLRRRGLDGLAAHFGIPQDDRHRALGDVRITVEVFFHLLELLAARGVLRLDQALDLQHHARDGRRFVCHLPRHRVVGLPTAPGIYRLVDADAHVLYVGKAKNLRERVGSYLSNAAGHSDKTLDLIRHTHDVRVQVAGSELEAALEEAEAIRLEKPPDNRLGKHLPRVAFLKITLADEYPRLAITDNLTAGSARYVGPLRSRDEAERVLHLFTRLFRLRTCPGRLHPDATVAPCFQGQIGACSAPCAARVSAEGYREQVDACLTLLNGDVASAQRQLIRRRDDHAVALRFEAAARGQRDLDLLEMMMRRQRTLSWVVAQQHFLVLQPAADRRFVLAYVVLGGRLVLRARLTDVSHLDALAAHIRERLPLYQGTPLRREEVDGTRILAAWLRDRGETDGCVLPIDPAEPATQHAEWRAACASLLAPPAPHDTCTLETVPPRPEDERQGSQHPRATGVAPTN